MDFITLTKTNLASEHICCAIAGEKNCQVQAKKSWLAERMAEGLVFKKGNVRGKCFIEYIPAEYAWAPIAADGYMYIDCLWVSGKFKGKGYSNQLLNDCIQDSQSKGKKGLVILSSPMKKPYLADKHYLEHKGFQQIDAWAPYFELFYLPFTAHSIPAPRFASSVTKFSGVSSGFVLYYTSQCPFTAKYVPLVEQLAREKNVPFHSIHLQNRTEAHQAPTPYTSYSLFYNGVFVTHEILSEKSFRKILTKLVPTAV